jgi:hypothetical protein
MKSSATFTSTLIQLNNIAVIYPAISSQHPLIEDTL